MSRFNIGRIAHDYRARYREEFCRLFARMGSLGEIRDVCWDLFSTKELVMFMRRIVAARMLLAGSNQIEITRKLGLSRNLVNAVNDRMQKNGKGIVSIEKKMCVVEEELDTETKREKESDDPMRPEWLIKRYKHAFAATHLTRDVTHAVTYMHAASKRKRNNAKENGK